MSGIHELCSLFNLNLFGGKCVRMFTLDNCKLNIIFDASMIDWFSYKGNLIGQHKFHFNASAFLGERF